jgi:pimeloyl-ACP methyl ester carboxylesterase
MAHELHTVLENAGERGPYVLVGHSMGGANVRWFLQEHGGQAAGMVLVDATTAESFRRNLRDVPEAEQAAFWANVRRLEGLDRDAMTAGYDGLNAVDRLLGDAPLAILTSGKPEAALDTRLREQRLLGALSSNSVQITASASGHNIHLDQPDLVARATVAVVRAARNKAKLTETQISAPAAP